MILMPSILKPAMIINSFTSYFCRFSVIESDYLPKGLAERINTASVDMFRSDWPTG